MNDVVGTYENGSLDDIATAGNNEDINWNDENALGVGHAGAAGIRRATACVRQRRRRVDRDDRQRPTRTEASDTTEASGQTVAADTTEATDTTEAPETTEAVDTTEA